MNVFETCIKRQEKIDSIVDTLNIEDITYKNLLVKDRIMNPSHFVVMLGETSAGKSTLINSLLAKKALPESVKPTTGVVTEVVISENEEESLLKIKRDGSTESIEKDKFDKFTIKPADDIQRLRYVGNSRNNKYTGIRVFDTPGYGSLVDYHEDVLKEFIPESDFIVYVVSYRVGLNDDDYQFLKYVGEIIGDKVEVVLAINMCPSDVAEHNKRVIEIKNNVNDCIHKDVKVFCIESSKEKNPDASGLWDYIYERVNDPKMKEELGETLKTYQDYILGECEIKVNSKIANIESQKKDVAERKKLTKEFEERKEEITGVLERGFTKTIVKSIKLIDKSASDIKEEVTKYINDETKWTKREETYSLMQHYYVPKLTSEETENILTYIEDEIILLDKTIEEMMNKTAAALEDKVKINVPCYSEVMEGILKKHVGDEIKQAAGQMFRDAQENGSELENADAYSKNLRKLENSLAKHGNRGLAKIIKAIRATSIKGITRYLSVFTESVIYIYDSIMWQSKISDMSMEAIDNWAEDVENAIRKYVDELKESNRNEVKALFDELSEEFKEDDNADEIEEEIDYNTLINLKREIAFILHKCLLHINTNK
ncbi:MAG: dynamin family protein [Clostridium sp.]|nr:dynamin family protein [Clostridium sp.]